MGKQELLDHLATGTTTVCRAWAVTRAEAIASCSAERQRPAITRPVPVAGRKQPRGIS